MEENDSDFATDITKLTTTAGTNTDTNDNDSSDRGKERERALEEFITQQRLVISDLEKERQKEIEEISDLANTRDEGVMTDEKSYNVGIILRHYFTI